jgi:hypothetical protein
MLFMSGDTHFKIIVLSMLVALSAVIFASGQELCTKMNEMQIISDEVSGYDVYLDAQYVGTEGKNEDALDGTFTVYDIPCWSNHTIVVDDGIVTYTLDSFFGGGIPYSIILEDPLFIRGKSEKKEKQ